MLFRHSLNIVVSVAVAALLVGCQSGDRRGPGGAAGQASDAATQAKPEVLTENWDDGSLRLRREVLVSPDGTTVNHGDYTTFHKNGKKAYQATFDHGVKEGEVTRWHDNGQVWRQEHFAAGVKEGVAYTWDEKGHKIQEQHFHKGKPHGVWTIWKGSGEIKWQGRFEDGKPVPLEPQRS